MKLKSIGVVTLGLLMSVGCSRQEKKTEAEVNESGLPTVVSEILLGDSCRVDTLFADEENVFMYVNNPDYMQEIIFDKYGLIANNPVLSVDSLTPTSFRIGDLITSVVVDFAIAENVETLRGLFPVYDDYKTVTYGKAQSKPVSTIFSLSVSNPDDKVKNAADIRRWAAAGIDSIAFNGSFKAFGDSLAGEMNECVADTNIPFTMYDVRSNLIYYMTDDFVTYFNVYNTFLGGAHGLYGYSFPTYLPVQRCPLTYGYMFKADAANDIREMIYEGFLAKTDFTSNHNINSVSQVRSYIDSNLNGDALPIPAPGLIAEGVVFCYQPYEVGAFADGAFQIVIPYEKLKPYMTDAGKKLVP